MTNLEKTLKGYATYNTLLQFYFLAASDGATSSPLVALAESAVYLQHVQ